MKDLLLVYSMAKEAKQIIDALVTEQVARSEFVAEGVLMADAVGCSKSEATSYSEHLTYASSFMSAMIVLFQNFLFRKLFV